MVLGAALGLVACRRISHECVYGPPPGADTLDNVCDSVGDDVGPHETVYGPPPEDDVYGPPVILDEPDSAAILIDEKP